MADFIEVTAGESLRTGDVIYLSIKRGKSIAKLARPKNWHKQVIGFAARAIKKGELMTFDPSFETGDIIKRGAEITKE